MPLPKIVVLLASYNGSAYLESQVNSILKARDVNPQIYIRDDGSADNTSSVIDKLTKIHSGNVHRVVSPGGFKGHLGNFTELCHYAGSQDGDYFCFSDQDDVWHRQKLQKLKNRLTELEIERGKHTPILVHSDLRVVDASLNEIAPSFIHYQGIPDPYMQDFPQFFFQNVVTGCTAMFNRALLELASPIPKEAIMHDWWFALCAKYFGILDYIDEPLVDYRQHASNARGAISQGEQSDFWRRNTYRALLLFSKHLSQSVEQARALKKLVLSSKLLVSETKSSSLNSFVDIKKINTWRRMKMGDMAITNPSLRETAFFRVTFSLCKWL